MPYVHARRQLDDARRVEVLQEYAFRLSIQRVRRAGLSLEIEEYRGDIPGGGHDDFLAHPGDLRVLGGFHGEGRLAVHEAVEVGLR